MNRATILAAIAVAGCSLAACATITTGADQTVSILTPGADDATCTLTSQSFGTRTMRAPGGILLPKSRHPITVVCTKECYIDGGGTVTAEFQPMAIGNVILGGGVGLVVDWVSGAYTSYVPQITVPMEKIPDCKPSS